MSSKSDEDDVKPDDLGASDLEGRTVADANAELIVRVRTPLDEDSTAVSSAKCTVHRLRYYVVVSAMLANALNISCNFAFNFASVCKISPGVDAEAVYNSSRGRSPIFYFPSNELRFLYAAYPIGNLVGLLALPLVNWPSMRWRVFLGGIIGTIVMVAQPPLYDISRPSIFWLKVIQGVASAPAIPAIGHVTAYWSGKQEIGRVVAMLMAYSQIGIFFTMSVSGWMCELGGWRLIHWVHAGAIALVSVAWLAVFRDFPKEHPWISKDERRLLTGGERAQKERVPYRKMAASPSVWAVIIGTIGNYNGATPVVVFSSYILKSAVGLSDLATSYFNSASFAAQLTLKIVAGFWTDAWKSGNETTKLRFFNTASCGLCGLLMCSLVFIDARWQVTAAILVCVTQAAIGFNTAGFNKAAAVVAKQHAHFLMTVMGMIISVSTIIEPFIVFAVVKNGTWAEWFPLFLAHGLILLVSNALFCILIRGKPAAFTAIEQTDVQK